MRKRIGLLVVSAIVLVAAVTGIVRAVTGSSSSWQSSGNPTLQKAVDLPSNVLPSSANFDCTPVTVKVFGSNSSRSDCVVLSAFGQVGADNGVIFSGTHESIPVVPQWPRFSLRPIPNQGMFMTYTSSSLIGVYLNFYRSIQDKIPNAPQFVNGSWQYTLTGEPDFILRGSDNKPLAVNNNSMAFSPNGSWMIVDIPFQGFVRINLATFEMQAFAASLQQGSDYSDQRAQLAISNDGRTVVIKPNNFNYFKVYDLGNCTSTSLPVAPNTDRCATRDYWSDTSSQISGFRVLYQPRFVNEEQISFTAVYDYAPGNFKVATYTLTAPGVNPSGIQYLGMGDSYASGEGAFDYVDGTDTDNDRCHLSTNSYAYLFKAQLFSSGHTVSCSGAVMEDITNKSNEYRGQVKDKIKKIERDPNFLKTVQSTFLPGYLAQSEFVDLYKPDAITLSISGNDIGFTEIVSKCASPFASQKACFSTYEDRLELHQRINSVFDELVATYRMVLKPGKRVYVVGYPQVAVTGGNCAWNVHLETSEIEMATDFINYFNATVERAAAKAGVRYVDITNALAGHRMCEANSAQVAINGMTAGGDIGLGPIKVVGAESYHPNALGHQLLAQAIRQKTNNLTQPMPGMDSEAQPPSPTDVLNQRNLEKTGRQLNSVVPDTAIVSSLLLRGQAVTVTQPAGSGFFKPHTTYKVTAGDTRIVLGQAATDALGGLTVTVTAPQTLELGPQLLHIEGPNLLGQPTDVYKTVLVAASESDYDGDGIPNSTQPCVFITPSGQDADKDGIDDACDGLIGDLPPLKLSHLTSTVTLTDNSLTITRNGP